MRWNMKIILGESWIMTPMEDYGCVDLNFIIRQIIYVNDTIHHRVLLQNYWSRKTVVYHVFNSQSTTPDSTPHFE